MSKSTPCDGVMEDLAALAEGDRDAIAKHAEHLASCDACRDVRHEATQLAQMIAGAGADHAPIHVDSLIASVTAKTDEAAPSATLQGFAAATAVAAAPAAAAAAAP